MNRRARIRRIVAQLHLWLGLTIGALWALQGATGALLVFHRDLDRGFGVQGSGGPPVALDRVIAAAGGKVVRVGVRDATGDVLIAERSDHHAVLIDAATARVLAVRDSDPASPANGNGWRWLYQLHEALLLGDRGETLIGISALFLLSTALAGLWLAWPPDARWMMVFDPRRWGSPAQRLYGWHRAAGLLACLGLVAMTASGAWMAFAADLRPLVARAFAFQPPAPPQPGARVSVTPGAALAVARAQFPNARFVRVTLPTAKANGYIVRLRQPDEPRAWAGTTSVTIDAASGRVIGRYDALTAPLANRLADAAFAVHTGEILGLWGRLLVLAVGLSLPLFYVTGLLGWLGRRRRRAGNRRVRERAAA